MNIVLFSITPLFPDQDMGGAQKHLRYIANELGLRGHEVHVLCTRRHDNVAPFRWGDNVQVHPILRFKQPFPNPYDTGVVNLANIVQDLGDFLARADRFYIHDGEMLFPYVYENIATVVGLRDNVYPETLKGAFLFRGHRVVVPSNYSAKVFRATVGRFFPELPDRLRVITNGIDWDHFQYTEPGEIRDIIPIDDLTRPILLHPHRPEPSKGLAQTLTVAQKLVYDYGVDDLLVLVPRWLGADRDPGVQEYYDEITARIASAGLTRHIQFHEWVPPRLMPQYYSMGTVTFSLGHFVESFGNSVYESLGCGTPTIAARIATHRELLPDGLLDRVDFDDNDAAAAIAHEIITNKRRTSDQTMAYLHEHYDFRDQLAQFAQVIAGAEIAQPMTYTPTPRSIDTRYTLAPWCYRSERGIYHDFQADYLQSEALNALLLAHPEGFAPSTVSETASAEDIETWYREGYIVPVTGVYP